MINFHLLSKKLKIDHKQKLKNWIGEIIATEGKKLKQLDIVLCSDEYLLEINRKFLNHDYFTDILTFNYSDTGGEIFGDIFISAERVIENAKKFEKSVENERDRIIAHGVLHLIGYNDELKHEKELMTKMEDKYLQMRM